MPTQFQRVIATMLLVATSPVLLLVALFIRVVAGRGVLFKQERVGKQEQPFKLVKFRTMHHPLAGGWSPVTVADDPRLIPGAALIRRCKLDELPQLLNVACGEMSLVGPRPTVPSDVERMTPAERRRHDVLPGMTGLAQVGGGTTITWPDRLVLDLRYVRERSWTLDVRIVVETLLGIMRSSQGEPLVDEWDSPTPQNAIRPERTD